MKVFVTDANYKHALGAIRSLGDHGFEVVAGSHFTNAQGFYSRYANKKVIYPNPKDEQKFVDFMLDYVKNNQIDVLLPIGYNTSVALSKNLEKFTPYVKIPVSEWSQMEKASNKDQTMELAKSIGIEIPKSYDTIKEIKSYPVVVKGVKESGHIQYINSAKELDKIDTKQSIIQEYVQGEGYGFFALFDSGQPIAYFMHKRRREYPITGGSSTAASSIFDEKLKEAGLKLLKSLNWHGIAMVEFKKDSKTGVFKLMEINPKFWGSLDLAIASGIDFPYLAVRMALNESFKPVEKYKIGLKYRWLFPDDTVRLWAKPSDLGVYLIDFFNGTKGNIWLKDLKPNLNQIKQTCYTIFSHLKKHDLKYPHGKPEVKHEI